MVLLNKAYGGYVSGAIASFPKSTEDALIAQGLAVTSSAAPTTGAATANGVTGRVGVAAGAASLVVTNPWVTVSSVVHAAVEQAAADGTALRVERVVPAAGSFTIHMTAAATATTVVAWAVLNSPLPAAN